MWRPVKITLENFMTHSHTEFIFPQNIVTLIQGINYDNKLRSNGSGKSSIVEATAYCLLGTALKVNKNKCTDSDLVRNGEKKANLEFELFNTRTNQKLVIKREIHIKPPSKLQIFLNDKDQKDKFATLPDGNKYILDLIGISKEDLLNYYIISKEKYVSYYSSNDNDKKEVIARFSKSNLVDGVENLIQEKLDFYNDELKELKGEVINKRGLFQIAAELIIYNDQIKEEEQKDYNKIKNELITSYEKQIEEKECLLNWNKKRNLIIAHHIIRYKNYIKEYQGQLNLIKDFDFTKELSKIDLKETTTNLEETKINAKKTKIDKELEESEKFLKELQNNLAGVITCPKCLHEFLIDEDFDVQEGKTLVPVAEKAIEQLKNMISNFDKQLKTLKLSYTSFESEREVYRKKIKEVQNKKHLINEKINRCNSNINITNQLIKSTDQIINNFSIEIKALKENIEDVKKQEIDNKIFQLNEKVKGLNKEQKTINKRIKEIESEIFKHEQWVYNFKNFKSYLANKSIKNIEGLANLMLRKMDSSLQVQLEGYGLLKNGELREKITPYILRDGFNEGTFFRFSGGERGDIEISTISGIQQLINLNTNSGGLDLLMIDEILESVDGYGLQLIAKSAKQLNKTILIISHVNIPSEEDYNLITIEKRNKISKIS